MAKISVVMPAYNAEKYICKSIDSILRQTFSDLEFIIVDDGSTDNTPNLIRKYDDTRIRICINPKNRGSVYCLRQAIYLSQTNYIATQDADDISFLDRLQQEYEFLEINRDIFCVGGHAIKINENDDEIGVWTFPPADNNDILQMLINQKKSPIINPTSMFRKNDYIQIGGYSDNPQVTASYDLELWTKAVLNGKKFANLQKFLLYYRWHPQSMTQRLKSQQISAYNKIIHSFIRNMKHGTCKKMDRSGT